MLVASKLVKPTLFDFLFAHFSLKKNLANSWAQRIFGWNCADHFFFISCSSSGYYVD